MSYVVIIIKVYVGIFDSRKDSICPNCGYFWQIRLHRELEARHDALPPLFARGLPHDFHGATASIRARTYTNANRRDFLVIRNELTRASSH